VSTKEEKSAISLPTGWRLAVQILGFVIGALFLAWLVRDALRGEGWNEIFDRATPGVIAGLLGCSLLSLFINGAIFWVQLRPVKKESFFVLQAVNCTASLLNYAPIRLGIVSRYVYHMRVDRMSFLFVTSWLFAIAVTLLFVMGSASLASMLHPNIDIWWFLITAVPLVLVISLLPLLLNVKIVHKYAKGSERMLCDRKTLTLSLLLRCIDLGAWAGRIWFATHIVDTGLSGGDVLLLAVAAVLVSLNPLGRLGYREAAVRWLAPVLAAGAFTGEEIGTRFAQLALIESGSEAMVVLPFGLISAFWWMSRVRRGHVGEDPPNESD
jgi:hypothetical protein